MEVEKELGCKVPGIGCALHVVERFEDAAMRVVHGPTTSPEEGVSKKLKMWLNDKSIKQTDNVCNEIFFYN